MPINNVILSTRPVDHLVNDIADEVMKRLGSILGTSSEPVNISVHETAELFNVSHITVRNWIKKGTLPAQKIGRKIIIKRSDVDNALKDVKSLKYKR